MATVLGVNAVFHDPAAALVVDGQIVAATEEERSTRRNHGKRAVTCSYEPALLGDTPGASEDEPLVHRLLEEFDRRTGPPVLVDTSSNTAGRPMVDDPRDALECFGSSPVDVLAIGPFLVRRAAVGRRTDSIAAPAAR